MGNEQPAISPNVQPAISPNVQPTISPNEQPAISPNVQPTISPNVQPTISPNVQQNIQSDAKPYVKPHVQPIVHHRLNIICHHPGEGVIPHQDGVKEGVYMAATVKQAVKGQVNTKKTTILGTEYPENSGFWFFTIDLPPGVVYPYLCKVNVAANRFTEYEPIKDGTLKKRGA